MLEEARARKRRGTEVVIGVVMTHGRQETERLAEGIETLPLRTVEHRGIALQEFDPDAAKLRHPGLLLVDELAHTNAPGSRHARRWQDVLELLEAGIDVHTTLNVQHVESLNDLVARITQVRVRETVPDSLLERADEIEMVDLAPEDRCSGWKVCPRAGRVRRSSARGTDSAARAALRKTAERVDAQSEEYRREHGIQGTAGTRPGTPPRAGDVPVPPAATDLHAPDRPRGRGASLTACRRSGASVSEPSSSPSACGETPSCAASGQIVAIARDRNVSRIVVGARRA